MHLPEHKPEDLTKRIEGSKRKDGFGYKQGPHPVLATPEQVQEECIKFSRDIGLSAGYASLIMKKVEMLSALDDYDAGELIHLIWLGFYSANSAKHSDPHINMKLLALVDQCVESTERPHKEYAQIQKAAVREAMGVFSSPEKCIETIINAINSATQ